MASPVFKTFLSLQNQGFSRLRVQFLWLEWCGMRRVVVDLGHNIGHNF